MLSKTFVGFSFLFLVLFAEEPQPLSTNDIGIIPKPYLMLKSDGYFTLSEDTGILYDAKFKVAADFLKTYIDFGSNIALKQNNAIVFQLDTTIIQDEAYKLLITPKKITISATHPKGAFYAVQSLRKLLPASFENGSHSNTPVKIKAVSIEDQPQFTYRGMHLDVGRHMYSLDFIKKYIDAMALLKMNTFHWHLTEDQGWRIEIKKYPKLQEIAAYRSETLIGHYSDQPHQFDGKPYGGYYTQEQIKEVVAYAFERYITVIPEIEMPGHSQAAIAAYPELGCSGEAVNVATKWGVFEDIYCTKEQAFNFLEDVLDEVMALFPSKYIHIGGDEAPKTRWKSCTDCQQRIQEQGLKDEHELQTYFITRIENYLNSKGRQIIGWDEILEGGLAPNATVMSWRGTSGAVEAAKLGHNVVMTPTSHCYFDYYQSDNDDEPLAIGGYLPLENVYHFQPIPEELTQEEAQFVLGAQGNIWTEYMPTEDQVEYMAFPRILAMSEVLWTHPKQKDYGDFIGRLENFHSRLDALDINYANHLYEIDGQMNKTNGQLYYQLSTPAKGKVIRYSLDGKEPDETSKLYDSLIPITQSCTIKANVFVENEPLGKTYTQPVKLHKATGKEIVIDKQPHKAYSGSGAEGLVNGISGSDTRYGDKEWLGFWGEDIEITIDLGKTQMITSLQTRFYNGNGQWIYAPKEIAYKLNAEEDYVLQTIPQSNNKLVDITLKINQPSRYVYLKIPNYGIIPKGKQGAGNAAWTFIDEIIIN
ncbi:MAG: family 20 glycosylhydrolase [Winogradskyella sp.]|nr:family 20 glycosylhydrolase [Winogradskyella sp.]